MARRLRQAHRVPELHGCMIFAGARRRAESRRPLDQRGRDHGRHAHVADRRLLARRRGRGVSAVALARLALPLRACATTRSPVSEETLKTTTNTDQAHALHEHAPSRREPRARRRTARRTSSATSCPSGRAWSSQVDVQGGHGRASSSRCTQSASTTSSNWSTASRSSTRDRAERQRRVRAARPGGYQEDWDRITEEVVRSTYRTPIDGKEIKVLLTVIDTGGEDGVTDKALAYYRRMRRAGLHKRIMLYKGTRQEGRRGDSRDDAGPEQGRAGVPVQLEPAGRSRERGPAAREARPRLLPLPETEAARRTPTGWITQAFFDELKAEVRNETAPGRRSGSATRRSTCAR
jgi:hypothetical protein